VRVAWTITLWAFSLSAFTAWADGAGELKPFPITGSYLAVHRSDLGRVAVMDFAGNYDSTLDSGADNLEARAVVAREFFRTHPDTYDFLVVFSTFEFDSADRVAMHFGVQNQVRGIGLGQFDESHLFGSNGHLLGYIDMGALSRHQTDSLKPAFESTLATLGHEVMHQWSGRARFVDAEDKVSTALLGQDGNHWSDLLDTNASVLYGHKWRDNHDGTFTSEAVLRFFSPLDLYLAGFYQASEVPPFLLIESPEHPADALPKAGITVHGRATTVAIEDVIAAEGPRLPSADQAQKQFHFAFILLTSPGQTVETADLAAVEQVSTKFAERFAVWTGGRAIAHVEQASPSTVMVGAPDVIETDEGVRDDPKTLGIAIGDGLAWLQSQQQPDGSWWDKPATAMRDTTAVVETLLPLASDFIGREQAVQWLLAQSLQSTDYRARQTRALGKLQTLLKPLGKVQQDAFKGLTDTQLGTLIGEQHDDGGWGLATSYASDPFDTALVLLALSTLEDMERLPFDGPSIRAAALQYLAGSQHADGGWSAVANGPSRLYVTTHVLAALQTYDPKQEGIEGALRWLASRQYDDGGFGDGPGTLHETAQALRTFIAFQAIETIRAAEAMDYLLSRQQTSGSWASSTYATALAVDALRRFHLPNWQLDPVLHTDAASPVDGDRIILTVTVRNNGLAAAPEGILRLFDGAPEAGGQVIGADLLIPPLAPGAVTTLPVFWETFGAAGAHTLVAVADPEQGLTEVNEQDNRATQMIDVAPAPDGVDLAVISLHAMPDRPASLPTTLGLSATVRNAGMRDAEQVRVQLWSGTVEDGQPVAEATHRIGSRQSIVVNFTYALTQPGTTVLTVVADVANAIAEPNEANNRASVTVETRPSVDLRVSPSDIEMAPMPGVVGSNVTFTLHLHNTGTQLAPPTEVRYALTNGRDTIDLGGQSVGIEAGGDIERTLTWRADQVGDWTLIVSLDPDNLVPETEEQNNIASYPFQVGEVDGPNLAVDFRDMTTAPNPGLEGQALTVSAVVRNTGNHDAQDVTVAFYQGDPDQNGRQIGRPQVIALLPSRSSVSVSFTWPQLPNAANQLVVVRADPDNTITEFSETDNSAFQVLKVLSRPDLALEAADIQLTPGFPAGGQTVRLQARVMNLGEQGVADVVVRVSENHAGGAQVGDGQRVSVAGRDTAMAEFTWTPGEAEAVQTLVVQVDPEDLIAESSEQNNIAQKRMAIQDRDFFVSNPYFSPNGDGIKDDTTFFFRWSQTRDVPAGLEAVVVDEADAVVREFASSGLQQAQDGQVDWDGLDNLGRVVRDGIYRFELRDTAGDTFGAAVAVVDNNRSPLSDAVGTPFGVLTNWTCQLGYVLDVVFTDDAIPIILADASDTSAQGIYRGRELHPIVQVFDSDRIESVQIAPDGSLLAYIWWNDKDQYQLVVMHRDTTNRQIMPLHDDPLTVLAISIETGTVIVKTREKDGNRRERILAVPITGAEPRILYQVLENYERIEFYGLSDNRKQLFIGTRSSVDVIDIASGITQSIYSDTSYFSIVEDVKWSPDGKKIAMKIFREDQNGISDYQIRITDHEGNTIGEINPALTGDSRNCIYIDSDNMAWSPESDALAFDMSQEGVAECLTGNVFSGGLYIAEVHQSIGKTHQIFEFGKSFRKSYQFSHDNQLGWFIDEEVLFYGFTSREIHTIPLQENLPSLTILDSDNEPPSYIKDIELSPTGRELFYQDNRASRDPENHCYQPGTTDLWSYKSLLNLTADLHATPLELGGGVRLYGTASDLNFSHYQLEYATHAAPEVWYPIQPAAGASVINDTFTTWFPPAPDTYWVRLTATDLAGNQRQHTVSVSFQERVNITELHRTPALFSPNGDGVWDEVSIHYRVLEPVHLTFDIYNDADERVRTIVRDHANTGSMQALVWDGRDDQGIILPDGAYRVVVQHVSLPITLDATPPEVELILKAPYQSRKLDGMTLSVTVDPHLIWSVTEPHLLDIEIEKAPIGRLDQWQTFIEPEPQDLAGQGRKTSRQLRLADVEHTQFRLIAVDRAGNRTEVRRASVSQLMIDGFGDYQRNDLQPVPYADIDPFGLPYVVLAITEKQVRFAIAENISDPLQRLVVQYAPVSGASHLPESAIAWREEELTVFLDQAILPNAFAQPPNRRLQAVWELPALQHDQPYLARLKGIDQHDQVYVSNVVMFKVQLELLMQGRILDSTQEEMARYQLPVTTTQEGKTGYWGLNVSGEALREVRFVLRSEPYLNGGYDPRYPMEQVVDRIDNPLGEVLVFEADVAPCMGYVGYFIGTTTSGAIIKSQRQRFQTPCLDMRIKSEARPSLVCNGASRQLIDIHVAPMSISGAPLKLLTLSRTDDAGRDDILFNVNRPDSAAPPPPGSKLEVSYLYVFPYDTSALQEGDVWVKGTLIDIYDNVFTQYHKIVVDHTPPEVTWTYPAERSLVCGAPIIGADGDVHNVIALEGLVEDQNLVHYLVRANGSKIHDPPSINSFSLLDNQDPLNQFVPPGWQSYNDVPLALLADRHGEVTIQLEALDRGGFRRCTERTFTVDMQAAADVPESIRELLSPNGDGILDEVDIPIAVEESGTLDVHIHMATARQGGDWHADGPVLRHVAVGRTLTPGLHLATWDGLDDSGNPATDGHYAIVVLFTDPCGNQSRREVFVEVDRTPPDVAIHYPMPGDPLTTLVEIQGRVSDVHLDTYRVELVTGEADGTSAVLKSGDRPVENGALALWNTFGLSGPYRIRLVARDRAGNVSTAESQVDVTERVTLVRSLAAAPVLFSPNGDGKQEQTTFQIDVTEAVSLTLQILDTNDRSRRTLALEQSVTPGVLHLSWDGTDEAGKLVSDGTYIGLLQAVRVGNAAVTQEERISVTVDATSPQLAVTRPTEGVVTASGYVQGSITDAHLQSYAVSLSKTPDGPATTVLSQGQGNVIDVNLGSLQGLQEGPYTLTIKAEDLGEIEVVRQIPFVVDNTPPAVVLMSPEAERVLGAKHNPVTILGRIQEAHLNQYRLRVGKGAEPAAWTELVHATGPPGSQRLGLWDITWQPDGLYTLHLMAEDQAGLSTDKRLSVTLDQTLPTVAFSAPPDGAYLSTGLTLMGTASDAHLASYRMEIAPVSAPAQWSLIAQGTMPVENGALGQWQALPPDGAYQLRLSATDAADNTAQVLRRVTVDTSPPSAPKVLNGHVTASQIELTWAASVSDDVIGYAVYRNAQLLTAAPVPDLTYADHMVTEGRYTYNVVAVDHAGLRSLSSPAVSLAVDVTPPQTRLTAPASGTAVRGVVEIRGTAYSRDDFKVYRVLIGEDTPSAALQLLRHSPVPIQANTLAHWSTLGLNEGSTYRVVLQAEDVNGNVGTEQVSVTVDNQAPAAPTGLAAKVSGTTVNLSWHANREPDLLGYVVYRRGQPIRSSTVTGDWRFIAISTAMYTDHSVADGAHDYAVAAVDQAGNLSDLSAPVTVRLDTRAPHAAIVQPRDGVAFDTSLYLLATVADRDVQHVQFAYKSSVAALWIPLGHADLTAPYEAYFDPSVLGLDYGIYELIALATDTSNQIDPAPTSIRVTYTDLTRPEPVEDVVVRVDGGAVYVQWRANREADLAGYHVERRMGDEAFSRLTSAPLAQIDYVDRELADAVYGYAVIAVDTYGNESAPTRVGPVIVYTPHLEPPPTPTTALTTDLSGHGMTVATVTGEMQTELGSREIHPVDTASDGQFTFTNLPLERGANHMTVRLTDPDNNISKPATVTVVSAVAPSPPTGLMLSVDDMTVDLTWNANPEPDIAGYRVWRNGTPVHAAQPLTGLAANASDNTFYAARVLDDQDRTYWYPNTIAGTWLALSWPQARLVNAVEVRWYSADYQAGDFDIEVWSGQQWVRVAAVRDNPDVQNHIALPQPYLTTQIRLVLRRDDGPFKPRVAAFGGTAIPLIAATAYREAINDGHYTYTVTAVNTYGFESAPSAPATDDVGDVAPPSPVRLTAVVVGANVHLSWTASAASDVQQYTIERDGAWLDNTTDLDRRQYVDAARKNGTYVYTVRPVDHVGNTGDASNPVRVVINVESLAAPAHLTVTPVEAGRALDLSWQTTADVRPTGFQVWRSTVSGGPYATVADTTDETWTDTGLSDGATYYYVVVAFDAAGNASEPSNEASGTPQDRLAPEVPILYYPTLAGYGFETVQPQTTIIGTAEPGVRVRLLANGRHVADTQARQTLARLDAVLGAADRVALSPDGRYVALVATGGSTQAWEDVSTNGDILRLYELETQLTIDITPVDQTDQLSWTGDSRTLIFNDRDARTGVGVIRQYDLAGDRITMLTEPAETDIEAAAISPDGRQLIVLGTVRGHNGLWRRALESETYISLLSETDGIDRMSLHGSPDGKAMVYWRDGTYEILDMATGHIRYMEDAAIPESLRWSPRGQFLVYVAANPTHRIRVYEFATETIRDLATGLAPQWSADGRAIWYIDMDRTAVVRHNLETGDETRFLPGTALTPQTLEVVPSGFIGALSQAGTDPVTYHRLAPAGRFVVHPLRLVPGDNIVTAMALDIAGNASLASESLVVTHRVGEQADLAIDMADLVILPAAPRAGELARISVTIENRGDGDAEATTLSLVAIDPKGTAQTVVDDFRLQPLAAGARTTHAIGWTVGAHTGTYTLVAVVDPENTLLERSEANNVALRQLLVPAAMGPAVAVRTDAVAYGANQAVDITVQLSNSGEPWDGQLQIAIEDANGIPVLLLRQEVIAALAYGERLVFDAHWHTSATFAGAYRAIAQLVDPRGGVMASAAAPFRIVEKALLTATVSTDRLVYGANEPVRVTGRADYNSGNQLLSGLVARLRILNNRGDVVAERNAAWGDVLPGATATAILDWHTDIQPIGTYPIVLEVRQGDAVLTQASSVLTIAPGDLEVSGHLTLSTATLEPPMKQTVTYTVANYGNVALRQLPIVISVLEPGTWITLYEQRVLADIGLMRQHTATTSFTTETLSLQRYVVLLQVEMPDVDDSGQRLTLATQNFVVTDYTPPLVTVKTLVPGSVTAGQAPVSITARDDGSAISRVEVRIDAGQWVPALNHITDDPVYRAALPHLAEGPHTLTARAIDTFENEGTSPRVSFTIDRMPPQIVVTGVAEGQTYTGAVHPVIAVHDPHLAATLTTLDGQAFVPGSAVNAEGKHHLAVSAADAAGNRTEAMIRFAIDATSPAITIAGVTANGSYNRAVTPMITVTDTRETLTRITLNGVLFRTGTVIDAEGNYELVVQATDAAGHIARKTLRFWIDRTAPVITLEGVEAGRVYNTDITPWVHIRDASTVVPRHTLNGRPFTSGTRLTTEGAYTLNVHATDLAGNVTRQSLTFTIDKMAPVIDIQGVQVDTVYRGEPYTYQVAAVDTADDTLSYALLTAPPDMAIDAATGLITWMPHEPGAYTVTVQVADTHHAAATQTYVLIVADPHAAPQLTSTPINLASVGQVYRYQAEAIDPNGEALTYRLEAAPYGMHIDATTGLIMWTPETHGSASVVVRVENTSGVSATQRYTLWITEQVEQEHH
jgi:subtilase family serine protease/fibronectin type 3 domain-containing protein/flagellar hook assembly protein FlgD/Tol biopolymer transport system component